ncbi:hypothetical protein AXF42_Ash012867 [Apostasia shenzhenica]|uniref:Uncharacterized protein n=1 Tax=Apostasia shenzhenica TaxID=1088818 RepID=A0A2I0AMF4_9ASPA|nr:hypothetical protein AXF42_Ash012867 [Apostasia shenzhenica]
MGECCSDDLSVSQERDPALPAAVGTLDRRYVKQVYDNVHGTVYIDPMSLKFIDTEQFQRFLIAFKVQAAGSKATCEILHALGVAYMVYPGAVHTRFEHSLGVYWLAGQSMQYLQTYQGAELDIDHFDVQTVKLAGLLHDIGHGPFSHLFEHEFLPRVITGSKWSHEQMSGKLVDYIVDQHNIDIDSECLRKVKALKEKHFLFDIVANGRNGIDVDKLLQSMRVMGDEICYLAKEYLTVHKLFATRADLHRIVYTHAKVKAIELMLVDALLQANEHLAISSYIADPAEYWKLDDTILKTIETAPDPELKESRDIVLRIRRRELYKFCNEFAVPKDRLEYFKDISAQDIVCSQKATGLTLREEDVAVSNIKIDLTHGRNNPLERISFFKVEAVSEAFENLQLRMYGVKAQVHETPDKKKRRR